MLQLITDTIWVHQSSFLQSNTTIVRGNQGTLLIDPGITTSEIEDIVDDIKELKLPVSAGFSTHPHWDHLLWHTAFGDAPRFGTARNQQEITDFFSDPNWRQTIKPLLPADIADQIPIDDYFGKINALPHGTSTLPWDGPAAQIIEHSGHAHGSAALLFEEQKVLVAGDMLSDILTPFLEFDSPTPAQDYLEALEKFEEIADQVNFVIPGHGTIGDKLELKKRISADRAYITALLKGEDSSDPRLTTGPQKAVLKSVHDWHVQQLRSTKAYL